MLQMLAGPDFDALDRDESNQPAADSGYPVERRLVEVDEFPQRESRPVDVRGEGPAAPARAPRNSAPRSRRSIPATGATAADRPIDGQRVDSGPDVAGLPDGALAGPGGEEAPADDGWRPVRVQVVDAEDIANSPNRQAAAWHRANGKKTATPR
jgi:hypothetical protein